mmetsp:Transcript_146246/g.364697  ORF Transcript_146246/g.364697 Transcript_146246/m.364697 type:complete len:280 (+) Transcript_146246:1130-1969(+)
MGRDATTPPSAPPPEEARAGWAVLRVAAVLFVPADTIDARRVAAVGIDALGGGASGLDERDVRAAGGVMVGAIAVPPADAMEPLESATTPPPAEAMDALGAAAVPPPPPTDPIDALGAAVVPLTDPLDALGAAVVSPPATLTVGLDERARPPDAIDVLGDPALAPADPTDVLVAAAVSPAAEPRVAVDVLGAATPGLVWRDARPAAEVLLGPPDATDVLRAPAEPRPDCMDDLEPAVEPRTAEAPVADDLDRAVVVSNPAAPSSTLAADSLLLAIAASA